MEDWVRDSCGVRFVGFENQEEAFVVRCCEGGECGNFLKWLIIFYVCKFESPDERCETFGTKSGLWSNLGRFERERGSLPEWLLLYEG